MTSSSDNFEPYVRRFEARNLNPYAQPVSSEQLRIGEVYFAVQYADGRKLIPLFEPLVFLGWGEGGSALFQNYESFLSGVRRESATNDDARCFQSYRPKELNSIFAYEFALEELMKCALRRRDAGFSEMV